MARTKPTADAAPARVTNPKTLVGIKKVSITKIPPVALIHTARAMMDGANKYGAYNYRESDVEAEIYVDAAIRHLLAWNDGEENASDSGVHHLGHAMACCAILLDAMANDRLIDDRPIPGKASEYFERFREKYEDNK